MNLLTFIIVNMILLLVASSCSVFIQGDVSLKDVDDSFGTDAYDEMDVSDLGTEQITLNVYLQPHEDEFLADDGYYGIKKFSFVTTNGSEICPLNQCKFSIEDGEFRPNSYSGGYTFEGRLKVTIEDGETKKSKFYNFNADLDKIAEEETRSKTIEILEGTLEFGNKKFDPDFKFDVTNGTLLVNNKNPILTILGER